MEVRAYHVCDGGICYLKIYRSEGYKEGIRLDYSKNTWAEEKYVDCLPQRDIILVIARSYNEPQQQHQVSWHTSLQAKWKPAKKLIMKIKCQLLFQQRRSEL